MDSFALGISAGMEKTAFDKEAFNPIGAFKSWRATRSAAAPVAKAMNMSTGATAKTMKGPMSKQQLSAVSQAQKSGKITTEQAQAFGRQHAQAQRASRAAGQQQGMAQKFQGPKPFSEHFSGMKPIAYTAAAAVPVAAIGSGAMSADQQTQY